MDARVKPAHDAECDAFLFAKRSPWANTFPIIKPGGDVMTSRLALGAAVAATAVFGAVSGASAQA
jgi:hypothetical protein